MKCNNKFRAWDNVANEMLYCGESIDVLFMLGSVGIECTDIRNVMPSGEGVVNMEHLKYMQYTGLKDKNGIEIYEGDIVNIPCNTNQDFHGKYTLHEIVKLHGQWINSYITSETGMKLPRGYTRGFLLDEYEFTPKLFLWSEDYKPHTEIEVVGNIFVNQDLLSE